jgi:hypothetical protein
LSKPAATPNGDGKVRPSALDRERRIGRVTSSTRRPNPSVGSIRMHPEREVMGVLRGPCGRDE